jgi:hypothetical protein
MIKYLYILLLSTILFSCHVFTPNQPRFTWEEPFTTDIKHYKYALNQWKANERYRKLVKHFPEKLVGGESYTFFYFPGLLQAAPAMELKIKFSSMDEALTFFESKSKGYKVELISIGEIEDSMYCFQKSSMSDSLYSLENMSNYRFMKPAWCGAGSGDNRELGGTSTGIHFDRENNIVICRIRVR